MEAREVMRRYVAALQETSVTQGQDLLAGFRLTRKAAQCLGEFGDKVADSGMAAALEPWGLSNQAQSPPEVAILGLTAVWVEGNGGLESAVTRTALAKCLGKVWTADPAIKPRVNGSSLVRYFLAIALCQRLAFDLGESLEAAVPGWLKYKEGLARLEEELISSTGAGPEDISRAGHWQGLAGWLWVTQVLENILEHLQEAKPL